MTEVALLLNGPYLQEWEYRATKQLAECADVRISGIFIDAREAGADNTLRKVASFLSEHASWRIYRVLTEKYCEFTPTRTSLKARRSIDGIQFLRYAERYDCQPRPAESFGVVFRQETVEQLSQYDLAVRFGFGVIKGAVLDAPTHGVLSFHHGDVSTYRGRPPGFWEFLHGETSAGVTLQRLNDKLDGGEIITQKRVDISDAKTWPETRKRLFQASTSLLSDGYEKLIKQDEHQPNEPQTLGRLYRLPELKDMIKYIVTTTHKRLQ